MSKASTVTSQAHGLMVGETIIISECPRWWIRLWRWVTRYKDPVYYVTEVTATTMTITTRK